MSDMNCSDVDILKQVLINLLSVKDIPYLSHATFACFSVTFLASTYSQYDQVLNEFDTLRIADNGCEALYSLLCLLFLSHNQRYRILNMIRCHTVKADENFDLLVLKGNPRQNVLLLVQLEDFLLDLIDLV